MKNKEVEITKNKTFNKFYNLLYLGTDLAKSLPFDEYFSGTYGSKVSPYSSQISNLNKNKVIESIKGNPWYILRELIRVEVGSTKRFIPLSNKEYMAILNAMSGGKTVVSAPSYTCKTTLLVIFTLMYRPKVVLYTCPPGTEESFIEDFNRKWRKFVSLMPTYVLPLFNFPHMVPMVDIYSESNTKLRVPGFKPKDIIMISDDLEFGIDGGLSVNMDKNINSMRKIGKYTIPWLITSSANYSSVHSETLDSFEKGSFFNVGMGKDLLFPIRIKDMPRFKSDKSKVKYYESQIRRHNLSEVFGTR